MNNAAKSINVSATPDAAKILRGMAKEAGITCLRIRKGTGCARGTVSVQTKLDSPRDQCVAAVAWLDSVCSDIVIGYSRDLWIRTAANAPEHFASACVRVFLSA